MAKLERGVEVGFGDFPGRAFIHHDVVLIAHVNEIEIALGLFGMGRVGHELAFDSSDADGPERAGPGNIADHQRRAGADDAENVGIISAIGAQDHGLHLHFVVPNLSETVAGSDDP